MGLVHTCFPDSKRAHSFTDCHVPCMEHLLFHGRVSADRTLCHLPCLTGRSWVAQGRLQPSRSLCRPLKFVMLSSPSSPCSEPDIFQKASGPCAEDPAITRHVGRAIETQSQPRKSAIMGDICCYKLSGWGSYFLPQQNWLIRYIFPDHFCVYDRYNGIGKRTISTLGVRFLKPESQ